MKSKLLFLVVSLLFSGNVIYAQKHYSSAIEAGVNLSTMNNNRSYLPGFAIGYRGEYAFKTQPSSWYLAFKSELVLNRSYGNRESFTDGKVKDKVSRYSLFIPINIGYKKCFSDKITGFVEWGPGMKFGLWGKGTNIGIWEPYPSGGFILTDKQSDVDNVFKTMFHRVGVNLNCSIGIEISKHYRIGFGYDYDMIWGYGRADGFDVGDNHNFTLSFGYKF